MESVGPDLHLIYDQGDWLYPPAHPDPHSMTSPESVPSTGLLSVDKDKERSKREAKAVTEKILWMDRICSFMQDLGSGRTKKRGGRR